LTHVTPSGLSGVSEQQVFNQKRLKNTALDQGSI